MSVRPETEKQQDIIDGIVNIESVNRKEVGLLLKKLLHLIMIL